MDIQRNHTVEVLCLSEKGYLKKIVEGLRMHES